MDVEFLNWSLKLLFSWLVVIYGWSLKLKCEAVLKTWIVSFKFKIEFCRWSLKFEAEIWCRTLKLKFVVEIWSKKNEVLSGSLLFKFIGIVWS